MLRGLVAFVIGLGMAVNVVAGDGKPQQFQSSGAWESFHLCGKGYCVWRALTSDEANKITFAVDFDDDGNVNTQMISYISEKQARTWAGSRGDEMLAKVRVDNNPFVKTIISRNLEDGNTLFWNFDRKQFGSDFVSKLKSGNLLRVRIYFGENDQDKKTFNFSLSGASRALSRARERNKQDNDWDDDDWGDGRKNNSSGAYSAL